MSNPIGPEPVTTPTIQPTITPAIISLGLDPALALTLAQIIDKDPALKELALTDLPKAVAQAQATTGARKLMQGPASPGKGSQDQGSGKSNQGQGQGQGQGQDDQMYSSSNATSGVREVPYAVPAQYDPIVADPVITPISNPAPPAIPATVPPLDLLIAENATLAALAASDRATAIADLTAIAAARGIAATATAIDTAVATAARGIAATATAIATAVATTPGAQDAPVTPP